MIVVSDTSAITALLRINHCHLLRDLYGEVLIPQAVLVELQVTHSSLPSYIRTEQVANRIEVERIAAELDIGEAEAIALAKERNADALLIDEAEGRRVADREGLRYVGVVGVLLQAKRLNHISQVGGLLEQLENSAGFYLSEDVKQLCLRLAGEA